MLSIAHCVCHGTTLHLKKNRSVYFHCSIAVVLLKLLRARGRPIRFDRLLGTDATFYKLLASVKLGSDSGEWLCSLQTTSQVELLTMKGNNGSNNCKTAPTLWLLWSVPNVVINFSLKVSDPDRLINQLTSNEGYIFSHIVSITLDLEHMECK